MADIDSDLTSGRFSSSSGAPWCQYCVRMKSPVIEELKKEYPGVTFMDVNTDENNALPEAFYVNGIPQMDLIVKKNPTVVTCMPTFMARLRATEKDPLSSGSPKNRT